MFPKKDTADGEADLKHGGDDAEWVEDPLVAGQNTPPGQLGEHDGVEADACEAESGTQVVEEWQVTRLRSAGHTRGSEEEDMAETKTKKHKVEVNQNIQLRYTPVEINTVVNLPPDIKTWAFVLNLFCYPLLKLQNKRSLTSSKPNIYPPLFAVATQLHIQTLSLYWPY